MHNWVAGEEITAAKLNDLNPAADSRISQAEHNILELYLENYYANKLSPFQGLFFDGFSDAVKAAVKTGAVSSATAGQAVATLATLGDYNQFLVDDLVQIYNNLHQEIKKVSSKNINAGAMQYSESDLASFIYTETDPNNAMADNGVVSGKREQRWSALGAGDDDAPRNQKYSKTFNVTSGVVYTIAVDKILTQNDAGIANQFETQIFVDGVLKASVGGGGAGTMIVTATATSATMLVEYKTRKIVIPGNGGYTFKFAWSNFLVTYTAYEVTCDSNFAFSYSSGTLKTTSATIDTSNKRLAMTAGDGDLKKVIYQSADNVFTQLMASAYLWIMRKVT